ncbi:voltage-dependent calcium channel unc-36 [Plakobranchus ocellatus]|uniref:Voltage-dependent calcium channel unc-36 n=1 Tax=Plakobranchus ocellatus TaxID=259542 RepID=A0AAV3Z892_9GAST|nr:voltage-dependent calcium channel unc-36 [Plakobranchus ocellatus]
MAESHVSPPQDRRAKHHNRPLKLSDEQVERVIAHIQSFKINAKLTCLDSNLQSGSGETGTLEQERALVNTEKEIYLRKAEVFYERKKAARVKSSQDLTTLAVAFDYQKALPQPYKPTNEIFYRRQLSVHSFNIHELADENVYIYVYYETVAKRGPDDVASLFSLHLSFFKLCACRGKAP